MTPSARNRWTLLAGAILLLLLAGAWLSWFIHNFERQERAVRSGMSAEARRNPYLAAERYLDRLGYAARTLRGRHHLKSPPAYPAALVVSDPGPDLPPAAEQRLLGWIEAGAHLVLTPRRTWHDAAGASGNRLLDRLGVRLRRRAETSPEAGSGKDSGDEWDMVTVRTAADGRPYRVAFDRALYLEDVGGTARRTLAGEHGAHVLGWKRGAGRITVLSDDRFMRNDRIGDLDHAWFLSDLLRRHDQVRLLIDSSIPPLSEWLWRNAPQAVVSACLLGIAWLWRASLTHGPRRRPRHRVRRNIIDHLAAAAAFAWRRDRGRGLLDGSRASIETTWFRRHPKLEGMSRKDRCEWIAAQTGLTAGQVAAALYQAPGDEPALVNTTNLQQSLLHHFRSGFSRE